MNTRYLTPLLVLGLVASLGVKRILQSKLVGVSLHDAFRLVLAPWNEPDSVDESRLPIRASSRIRYLPHAQHSIRRSSVEVADERSQLFERQLLDTLPL
jgi:hypothetical protein